MSFDTSREHVSVGAFGIPGTGKTTFLNDLVERMRPARLIALDTAGEHSAWGELTTDARRVAQLVGLPRYRVRFKPVNAVFDRDTAVAQFDWLCRLVMWQVNPQPGQGKPAAVAPVVFVVEELQNYVGSSFQSAPASWRWLAAEGRKYGVALIAASQRPEQIDKSFLDLCSVLRVHRVSPRAAPNFAEALGVPVAHVRSLVDHQFFMRESSTGRIVTDVPELWETYGRPSAAAASKPAAPRQRRSARRKS